MNRNDHGQPIGLSIEGWTGCRPPPSTPLRGIYCSVEPLDPARHVRELFGANSADAAGLMWTYMPYGPFARFADYEAWGREAAGFTDPMYHAIVDRGGSAIGVASYLRIDPPMGVIEVGNIAYSPALQRTAAATEAMYLMMSRAFDELGYRRYEWKCDALNAPSRAAAQRLGFTYEGTFRQALVYKARNRDTAWYSIVDSEWPQLRDAFEKWLAADNFDADGRQRRSLAAFRSG